MNESQPNQFDSNLIPTVEDEGLDLKQLVFLFLDNWYLLALGLGISILIALLSLRYATPVYQVSGSLLINEKERQSFSEEAIMADLGFTAKSNVENELQILKSSSLMERVVDSLKINIEYIQEGRLKSSEQYKDSPIIIKSITPKTEAYGRSLKITTGTQPYFNLIKGESDTLVLRYGVPFEYQGISYIVDTKKNPPIGTPYTIRIKNPSNVARSYSKSLILDNVGRSNVISISLRDAVPQKAIDIINKLLEVYNISAIEQKSSSGQQTLDFIDDRLRFITDELYDVEKEVEGFKKNNQLSVEISLQAQQYLEKIDQASEQLMELKLRKEIITNLRTFLTLDSNQYKILPLASDVLDDPLAGIANDYNKTIFARSQLLESATIDNPAVATYDEQLHYLRETILQSIISLEAELIDREKQISTRLVPIENQIKSIPANERLFLQIMRQQQIKEELFLYLLQKREETALSIVAQVSNSRILDPTVNNGPISPNGKRTYLVAIVLGLAIPGSFIFLRNFFDNKIYSKQDIQKITTAPFLGEIGIANNEKAIVINRNTRSSVAEMFRLLRTNLQFVAGSSQTQTILVTSSISGEGKSFITINLGISQSLSNKRTILIGLDLRKPKMTEYLIGKKSNFGMTNYLVGEAELEDIIQPLKDYPNVDFIGSGPIPPNPAELLMNDQLEKMLEKLKAQYDFIIIDTAPLGLVTDAFLISPHVDQSIIVTRYNKTKIDFVKLIDEIYQHNKLSSLGIVLNGVRRNTRYGYGYGYGYGYYEEDPKSGWFYKLRKK